MMLTNSEVETPQTVIEVDRCIECAGPIELEAGNNKWCVACLAKEQAQTLATNGTTKRRKLNPAIERRQQALGILMDLAPDTFPSTEHWKHIEKLTADQLGAVNNLLFEVDMLMQEKWKEIRKVAREEGYKRGWDAALLEAQVQLAEKPVAPQPLRPNIRTTHISCGRVITTLFEHLDDAFVWAENAPFNVRIYYNKWRVK